MRIALRTKYIWPVLVALLLALGLTIATPAGAATVNPNLRGHLDRVVGTTGTVSVAGWAADFATPHNSIGVGVTIAGTDWTRALAHDPRPDIGRAYPALGPNHGFHMTLVGIPAGIWRVCAYAIDPNAGPVVLLGCLNVAVPANHAPSGHLDGVTALSGDRVQISGWAADIDTPAAALRVQIYLGGRPGVAYKAVPTTANLSRPDVWAAFPGLGPNHGFSVITSALPGATPVCVYAADTYALGGPTLLGCPTVTVG
jgi:hypothetical protein